MRNYRLTVLILTIFLLVLSAAAQGLPPNQQKVLERAEKYAQDGRVEEALQLLNPLLLAYPDDTGLLFSIFRIYRDAKDYDNALDILNRRKKINLDGGRIYLDYADIYLKIGALDSARSVFDRYLKYNGFSYGGYLKVSQAYLMNGYYSEATDNYLDGRKQLNDSSRFALELGNVYQRQRQYYPAAMEYYRFIISDSMNQRTGESQLRYLIENADESEPIKRAFQDIIAEHPESYLAYRYYADVLVKEDNLDSAFEYYKMADRHYQRSGEYLLHFSNICLEKQDYRMAARVCRYLLNSYPNMGFAWGARINLALAFIKLNDADSAIVVYHEIMDKSPELGTRLQGMYLLGRTFLEQLYKTDSARFYFDRLISRDRLGSWKDRVMLRVADSYLVDDDLERADSIYLAVNTSGLEKTEREELLFKRAQIKFFKQEYTDARGLYNHLVGLYPRSLFVNDCLKKVLIIDENQGMGVFDLDHYSEAEHLLWQNKVDSALARLVALSERGGSNLSALAAFQAGEIHYKRADYNQAFEYFSRVLNEFEGSFYNAESQKYIGDLYFYHFNDHEKAREAYRIILENYSNRLLYEYARRQLRKLES